MAQIIVPTITALAVTYGAGATNTLLGGGLGFFLGRRVQRIDKEIAKLKEIQASEKRFKKAREKEKEELIKASEKPLGRSRVLSDKADPKVPKQPVQTTADKIKIITEDRFSSSLVSKQLTQLEKTRRIDKANQGSCYAQMAMGAGQIAVATSSIGHVAGIVAKAVIGFSLLSSLLYLGASAYGFARAIAQLSDNRKKQEVINRAIEQIEYLKTESPREKQTFNSVKEAELALLQHSLKALKAEEGLLIQQRNSQLINIIAALLSLAAMALFTVGPQGIVYYALLAGSILLPLIALGYSAYSMNEKKYMAELHHLLQNAPSMLQFPQDKEIGKDTLALVEHLLEKIVSLEVTDPSAREELRTLFQDLKTETNAEIRLKSLKELYAYLMKLQERSNKVDLEFRLKIEGMSMEELEKLIPRKLLPEPIDDGIDEAVSKSLENAIYYMGISS